MRIRQILSIVVERRYHVLRFAIFLVKLVACIILLVGTLFSGWFAGQVLIPINDPRASVLQKTASFGLASMRFGIALGASLIPFLLLYSFAQYTELQIAIEENTRYATHLLLTRLEAPKYPPPLDVSQPPTTENEKEDSE
jgi:hypothetical protein